MRRRLLDPDFFTNYELWSVEHESGLPIGRSFQGLWCAADREGRFKWDPQRLKVRILPYDVDVDFAAILDLLERAGFIRRYEIEGERFGCIPTFLKHQTPHVREAASSIPPPPSNPGKKAREPRHSLGHAKAPKPDRQGHAKIAGRVGKGVVAVTVPVTDAVAVRANTGADGADRDAVGRAAGPAREEADPSPEPTQGDRLRALGVGIGNGTGPPETPEKAAERARKREGYKAMAGAKPPPSGDPS